ncbi:hypothetical protein FOCC_FOCC005115 [Frankliniella occidentalis]|nr:hypothetical protein FOCC_FOCC005115 [Frankliniella occidentalis]
MCGEYGNCGINMAPKPKVSKPPSSKTHVDNSVGERRLRQIYDWLDNGNNKNALQEAGKVLKKQPDFLCVKVLKALALLRLGKEDECHELLEAVRKEVPIDDQTLQAMQICYRETQQPNKICEMYDAAAKKDPTNEEILTNLFMAHVRLGDYKQQQQTALRLYKVKPKNPYYFWAVMSVVMQAYHSDEKIARMVTLPLAERMVQKFIDEGKIEAEQEVQLYLLILEKQGKFQEALDVVEGPMGERLISYVTVPQKKASLYVKLNRWRDSIVISKSHLRENLDHWLSIKNYLTSAMNLMEKEEDLSSTEAEYVLWSRADASIPQIKEFLKLLMNEMKRRGKNVRGPYLAWLELYKMVHEKGQDADQVVGDIVELFVQYFRCFGDRSCCPLDLKQYLPMVSVQCRGDLIKGIWQIVGLEDGELPDTVYRMQQHISTILLSRHLGYHENLSSAEKLQLTTCFLRYFQHGMRFNIDPLPTDFLSNDPYVLLMAHLLLDVWMETQDTSRLLDVLLLLEHALLMSPSNFHFKLLLVKVYHLLGAGVAAHDVYETLDVKHMQLDSLGYVHCGAVQATGQYATASSLYDVTLRFFTVNYKDSVDYLSFTYKFGSFMKIEEFVEFRERLSNSMHYGLVTVERMLLDILHSTTHPQMLKVVSQMEIQSEKDKMDWRRFNDNRDMSAYICWDPPERQVNPEVTKKSRDSDVSFLRLRMLLLRGLGAAAELCNPDTLPPTDESNVNSGDVNNAGEPTVNGRSLLHQHPLLSLEKVTSELQSTFKSIQMEGLKLETSKIIGAPPPSRLFDYLETNSVQLQCELFSLISTFVKSNGDDKVDAKAFAEGGKRAITILQDSIHSSIKAVLEGKCVSLNTRRFVFERAVNLVEMVCLAALVCGIINNILEPSKQTSSKKTKKKQKPGASPEVIEAHKLFVSEVQTIATELHTALGNLRLRMSVEAFHSQMPLITANSIKDGPACRVPAVGTLPTIGPDDISALSTAMAQLVLSYENRKSKDKGYSVDVSAKLSESYEDSLQEIITILQQKMTYLDSTKL